MKNKRNINKDKHGFWEVKFPSTFCKGYYLNGSKIGYWIESWRSISGAQYNYNEHRKIFYII